jgi:anti-anti-sigma factor
MAHSFDNQIPLPSIFRAIEETEKIRTIRFQGSVDISQVSDVEQFIKKFRAQEGFEYKHLLFDFSEVSFIDSAAIAAILKTLRDYKKKNHRMVIVNANAESRNQDIFEVYKVDQVVHFHQTEAEAIKDLES